MNKKNIFRTLAVAAVATVAMTSCDNSAPKMDDKSQASERAYSCRGNIFRHLSRLLPPS